MTKLSVLAALALIFTACDRTGGADGIDRTNGDGAPPSTVSRRRPADRAASSTARASETRAADGPLCRQAAREPLALKLARAAYGDVMVLKFEGFDDHEAVAVKARKAGARAAHASIAGPAHLVSRRGIISRTAVGLTATALSSLKPYLTKGRMPRTAARAEIMLSALDAEAFGLTLEAELSLTIDDDRAPNRAPKFLKTRLVGVVEFPVEAGLSTNQENVWMSLETARTAHPNMQGQQVTSLALQLEPGSDAKAWTKQLRDELGNNFSLLTAEQLQEPALQWQRDVAKVCARGNSAGQASVHPKPRLAGCGDLKAETQLRAVAHSYAGDAIFWAKTPLREPQWGAQTWFEAAARSVRIVGYSGTLFTRRDAVQSQILGVAPEDRASLAKFVRAGDIAAITPRGGIAMWNGIAKLLGLAVGDKIHLAVRPPHLEGTSEPEPLNVVETTIAATLDFPIETQSPATNIAWLDRQFAARAHPRIGPSRTNAIVLWAKAGEELSLGPALLGQAPPMFVLGNATEQRMKPVRRAFEVLKAYCAR